MKTAGYIPLNQWMLQHDVSPAQMLQAERRGIHLPIVDGGPALSGCGTGPATTFSW